jgi:hypothetical protein
MILPRLRYSPVTVFGPPLPNVTVFGSVGPRAGLFWPGPARAFNPRPETSPARDRARPSRAGPKKARPEPGPVRTEKPGPARGLFEFFYYFLKEFLTSSFHRNIKNQSFLVNLIIIFKKLCYFQNKLILVCKKIS